jgi:hypothetical protein
MTGEAFLVLQLNLHDNGLVDRPEKAEKRPDKEGFNKAWLKYPC